MSTVVKRKLRGAPAIIVAEAPRQPLSVKRP